MEKEIKIAAKLYKCRDAVKSIAKMQSEDFWDMIQDYVDIIQSVMKRENLGHLEALLLIAETKTYQESANNQLLFMAAITEMMEPSK